MLAAEGQPWAGEFARRVMLRNFHLDREIQSNESMASILADLGLPAPEILATARSDAVKSLLREQTETAKARKIFGAPTFFVGGEMFWGNDRLQDALLCASHPAASIGDALAGYQARLPSR
jgi:2-hydroxychromene-2-carboxylate isomerase